MAIKGMQKQCDRRLGEAEQQQSPTYYGIATPNSTICGVGPPTAIPADPVLLDNK